MGRERWRGVHGRSWLRGDCGGGQKLLSSWKQPLDWKMEWSGMFSCLWVILTSSQVRSHMCFSRPHMPVEIRYQTHSHAYHGVLGKGPCLLAHPSPHVCFIPSFPLPPPASSSPPSLLPLPPSPPHPLLHLSLSLSARYGIQCHLNNSSYWLGLIRLQSPKWIKTYVPNSITWEISSWFKPGRKSLSLILRPSLTAMGFKRSGRCFVFLYFELNLSSLFDVFLHVQVVRC